jgi:hypothetical protein
MLTPVSNDEFVSADDQVDLTRSPYAIVPTLGSRLGLSDPEILPRNQISDERQGPQMPAPTFDKTLGAAFRQDNTVGSALSWQGWGVESTPDPDFDFTNGVVGTKYEPYIERFAERSFNKYQQAALMRQIDQEEDDRRTLAFSGWGGVGATLAASILDPVNLVPVGGTAYRGVRAAETIGKIGLRTAAAGGIAAGISEAGLQATQETRPASESALAIGGGVVLGGMLGTAAGALLARSDAVRLAKAFENVPEMDANSALLPRDLEGISGELQSAGAAAAPVDTLDDLSIAGKPASAVAKATAKLNPLLRTMTSPSRTTRAIASQLMENPAYLKKNFDGQGVTAAETAMKEYTRGAVVQALQTQEEAYQATLKAGNQMSRKDFREDIGRAIRRNDTADNPQVAAAAQAWRKHVIEPLKGRSIELGLLPKDVDVTTAESYFSRLYNRTAIEANESDFKRIVREWVDGTLTQAQQAEARKAEKRVMNLTTQKEELEMGILRREETARRRAQGGEIGPNDFNESDVLNFVRRVQAGERPQAPESLSDWLRRQHEGIYDPGGDLVALYPELKSMPGALRKSLKSRANPKGGISLDDLVQRAWDEGFLNDSALVGHGMGREAERPTIREFLDALDLDRRGERQVRVTDIDAARTADEFDRAREALDRAGVDFERPMFATSESQKDLVAKVNRALEALDRERIGQLNQKIGEASQRQGLDFVSEADRRDYLEGIVQDIFNHVTGRTHDGDVPTNLVMAKAGPLKERTFNIPDQLIEKYLQSDVEEVGPRYARLMSAEIELTERFGSADMKGPIQAISDDFQKLRDAVEADKTIPAVKKNGLIKQLTAQEKADIRDIEGVRDLLRGNFRPDVQHTNFARIAKAFNAFNYIRAMGGVWLASLTDAAILPMQHGFANYMNDGLKPLIKSMAGNIGYGLSKKEAELAGAVSEKWLGGRLATLAELTDPYSSVSPFERFLDNVAKGFSKATLLDRWDDFQKGLASVMIQNRILRNAEKAATNGFDALAGKERAYMAFLGLNEARTEELGKLFATHGETMDGVRIANTERWGDDLSADALRRAYRAAINKDTDSLIVTKGVGDVPLFAHTPLGRSLLQFRTFALATNQRLLMRGLQEGPVRFVGGVMAMSTIGMFIYMIKQLESGRPISDNPGTWIAEGIDRSGVLAIGMEINNTLEKMGAPGLYSAGAALFPDKMQRQTASRYAVRGVVGSALGPSFGGLNDIVGLLSLGIQNGRAMAAGEPGKVTTGDIGAMRRLTPFASLPYWRWLIDGMAIPELKKQATHGNPH